MFGRFTHILILMPSYAQAMELQEPYNKPTEYKYYIDANHHEGCKMEYTPLCIFKARVEYSKQMGWRLIPIEPQSFEFEEVPLSNFLECTPALYENCFNKPIEAREITFDEYIQLCARHLEETVQLAGQQQHLINIMEWLLQWN